MEAIDLDLKFCKQSELRQSGVSEEGNSRLEVWKYSSRSLCFIFSLTDLCL